MRHASTVFWIVVVPLLMISLALLQATSPSPDNVQADEFSAATQSLLNLAMSP